MNHTQSNKRHKKFSSIGRDLTKEIFDGSTYKTKRKIDGIGIHCSFSPQGRGDDAFTIDRWHQENDGWGGIGYHYVILEDGTIQKGRWVDNRPIHARGFNSRKIAICRIGGMAKDGKAINDATDAQIKSIKMLCKLLISKKMYNLSPEAIKGHNEYPRVNKSCPLMDMDEVRDL